MKKLLVLLAAFLFFGANAYAAPGDLVVNGTATINGNLGVGVGVTFSDGSQQTRANQPIQTQNVVTSSRVLNTVYRNTTGRPLFVAITCVHSVTGSLLAYTDSSNPPTTTIATQSGSAGFGSYVFFIVLPGNYYKARTDSAGSLVSWTEWY